MAKRGQFNLDVMANKKVVGTQQRYPVADTAVPVSELPEGANGALWSFDGGPARVRLDGTAPTATNGLLVNDGAGTIWSKEIWEGSQWIRATASSGTLHMQPVG